MIPEPGDANRKVTVTETFHVQTDDELSDKELKRIEADDQAIQTILLGLPEDIYAVVDSCETSQEIWLRVQQMMKASDIGIQDKKAKLFNEWERFTSNEGESIKSYYHRFLKLMNDLKRKKHFPEKIARNENQNQIGNGNLVAARAEGNAAGQNRNQIRCYNCRGVGHYARNCTVSPRRRDAAYLQTQLLIAQKEEAEIQLQAEEYDLMAAAADLDEIEEANAKYILMANLQQASTSGTQTDSAPVYDSDGSSEVHENCDDNEIFNRFTQEEQYTELLKPIPESHQKKIKELNKILLKTGQSIQTIHMLSPKPDLFYHTEQKMALGYQNPFYLKQAQKKQQSLYDEKVLLEKHDPLVVHDSEEALQLAQESREKMKQLNKEIKPANYTEINHLSGEADKFVGDFKSLANEADASLAKHNALELEIERLMKAVFSQDIMNIGQKEYVVDTSDLQTDLERTKEPFENCIIKKKNEYAKLWNDWYK
nr:hypothetical protein [Tanacetum cinerariifolium]